MEPKTRPSFYSIEDFPQLHELCRNWETVRDEFLQLDAPLMNVDRQGKKYDEVIRNVQQELSGGNEYGWIRGWGRDGGNSEWIQYGILTFNEQVNQLLKPHYIRILGRTHEMLSKIDGIKICAFVKLKARALLPCHTHPEIHEEKLLQLHLPLVTAAERNYAYLNVRGEFRQHRCGEPIVFDGSLDHFALNESDVDRTILYMEFKTQKN